LVVVLLTLLIWCFSGKRPRFRKDYNTLVNSMPIGYMQIVLELDKSGTVKKVIFGEQNKTFQALVNDHNLRELKAEEYDNYWQKTADSIIDDPEPKSTIIKAPDEDIFIEFLINSNPKSTESRLILDLFTIDVTDKVQVEKVLREAARAAIEADNMKSQFLANMSHEIRTPLNAIVGFSNLLCKTLDPQKKRRFVEIIETNNHLLLKLIGDILDISKSDSGKLVFNMSKVNVNKLMQTVCSSIDMSNRPNVKLELKPGLDECYISTDSYRLTQVFNNLLTNAIKFTDKGSITMGYDVQGELLRFYVKDTGLGISESDIKKLFTRFTKLNSFIQGTGLGLSISKTIVERLGGTMRVESQGRGLGSTFYFTIPYVLNADDDEASSMDDGSRFEALKQKAKVGELGVSTDSLRNFGTVDASKPSYKYEKKKLLIVEDTESNSELFDALLEDRFELVHAWDGDEAVRMFAKETPDMVIMDINLPLKDGYEAAAEIRRLAPDVPIIAVTAYAQRSDEEKVMKSGFNAYLAKPVEEEILISTIRRFL
ncbi:MAG: response regulator, partial [Muribaculaceae bacterium]|nr:response regulator [Muribaculaceae bacterium]